MKSSLFPLCSAALLVFGPALSWADELAANAKKIFQSQQDAVVWISGVTKLSFTASGGNNLPDSEQKMEALATVIDPSGLTVTALSEIDPSRNISGREVRTANGTVKIDASAVVKEVKIILPDGTEVPAELVLKDADLDLAFIRPKAGSKEAKGMVFKAVDLDNSAKAGPTDDAITVARFDEVLNRQPSVTKGQITGVTKKPREFLRATGTVAGCPTFTADGKLIGVTVNRSIRGKGSHNVIIPAADIREIAEQAKAAKPEPPKEEKKNPKPEKTSGDSETDK